VLIAALLAAATLLLRLPLLAPRLAHWDAVNYALGFHDFNIAAHQPHPPGSPYFILAGRAALALTGDDNAALLLITLIASVAAVIGEYVLVRTLYGKHAALLAAVVLLTQPVFWGYGTVGTAWTLLAALAVCLGLMCLAVVCGGHRRLVIPSAVMLGCASGFRLDVTVFLAPLWLWTLWRAEPRWRRRVLAIGLVVVSVLVWLVPVALSAGGFDTWLARLLALLPSSDAAPGAMLRQLLANTAIAFGTLAFTLGPLVVVGVLANHRRAFTWQPSEMAAFWALWILPAFTFLWLVDSTEPGHDLIFVPALVAVGVGVLARSAQMTKRLAAYGAVVVALQTGVFLLAAPLYNRPLAWTADSMLLNVTAPGLRLQQTALESALATIRTRFDPKQTVLITLVDQDPYRFLMYYLPDYTVLRLDPASVRVLTASGLHQDNWTPVTDCLARDAAHAVWVLSSPLQPGDVPEGATRVTSADDGPFQVWDVPGDQSTRDYLGFRLGGPCGAG
jgi:4-amino-4-deoxy-L-arabinose transferase-like glycosyltransferase